MHDRHVNRERYFNEQVFTTNKFVIPYIETVKAIDSSSVIMEIGCGEGGNLKPFLDLGCTCIGIDMAEMKIENGKKYFENDANVSNISFVVANIYDVSPTEDQKADVVILRDVIEHIYNQEEFVLHLRKFLKKDGIVFFAYPPWRMPFGGHQQVLANKFWSKAPYWHLLPRAIVRGILKTFELHSAIPGMMEILDTGISTSRFKRVMKIGNFEIAKETFYFINPNFTYFQHPTRA
jgi:SAM-dependent methyltransferase